VGVNCSGPNAKGHFALLQKDKEAIEHAIGCTLEWEELPNRQTASIRLSKRDVDPINRDNWPSQHEWMAENLEAMYKEFAPRIKELSLDEQQETSEDE
jgi:hypothetical protein